MARFTAYRLFARAAAMEPVLLSMGRAITSIRTFAVSETVPSDACTVRLKTGFVAHTRPALFATVITPVEGLMAKVPPVFPPVML